MGVDLLGFTIVANGIGGVSLSTLAFNSAGRGSTSAGVGSSGWKANHNGLYYSGTQGWEVNTTQWKHWGMNLNGVFTCPVTGFYAMGFNGLHRGGSNIPAGYNTYGYAAFAKNGAMSHYVHWNMSVNHYWGTGGTTALFSCAAGDSLAFFVNRSPVGTGPDCVSQNLGVYPSSHHVVWFMRVG